MSINATDTFFAADTTLQEDMLACGLSYEPRPQQVRMAQAIATAFTERRHACIEAPTGVGKTFAYLVPAIFFAQETKRPVVVSTHTINLQEQICKKDLPLLGKLLKQEISYAVAKGRNNYLCLRRLSQIADMDQALLPGGNILGEIGTLLDWAERTRSGDYSEMDRPVPQTLWQAVCSERGNCLAAQCPFFQRCFLMKARRSLMAAQIIVSNHAFFFSALALRDKERKSGNRSDGVQVLPEFAAVILDEGHTLEDTAASHLGLRAESYTIRHTLNRLFIDDRRPRLLAADCCHNARKLANDLRARAEVFFNQLREWIEPQTNRAAPLRYCVPNHIENYLAAPVHQLCQELDRVLEQGGTSQEQMLEIKAAKNELEEQCLTLDVFFSMSLPDYVYWFELQGREAKEISFNCIPVDVAPRLRELLFATPEKFPVIITSATLAIAGDINFFLRRIGAECADALILDTPFDYSRQVKVYLPDNIPPPNSHSFLPEAERHLKHFLSQTNGRAFVLFTSYAMLNQMAERLESFFRAGNYHVYIQGDKYSPRKMLELFRKNPRSVILGTSSFWTGVDVTGEALSNVIITKLPFAVPDHPLIAARSELIQARGGSSFSEYSLPEAVLKFRQGFGRLIRSRDDHGIVVILDGRIRSKYYGKVFLQSIPECPIEMFS
jgi:ATP-dependent DNA helicase DinG